MNGDEAIDGKLQPEGAQTAQDICALPLVRRLAALLDRDPLTLNDGDPLPHGWHVILFNPPTRQSALRPDGAAELGVPLPDLGLPRLMMGGRQMSFVAPIPIGARVTRVSQLKAVTEKQGRSGRFALVDIEQQLTVEGSAVAAVTGTTSYILLGARKAEDAAPVQPRTLGKSSALPGKILAQRVIVPDTAMLFRYSAITDNPHRIHYDLAYAQQAEGFPALVVNGTVPILLLLEMFKASVGREPARLVTRNLAPIYCGRDLSLSVAVLDDGWALRAVDNHGTLCMSATAQ